MNQGKLVFAQLMFYLPLSTFRRCVADHRGEHKVKDFSCLDQFFSMAFANCQAFLISNDDGAINAKKRRK